MGATMQTTIELDQIESSDEKYQRWMKEFLNDELPRGVLEDHYFMRMLFIKAAKTGDLEVIKRITEKKYCPPNSDFSLNIAIENGHLDVAYYLIPHNNQQQLKGAFARATTLGPFELVIL